MKYVIIENARDELNSRLDTGEKKINTGNKI